MERSQVINFGAGPSALPQNVLEEAARGLLNYKGTGIGITEISHRGKEFQQLTNDLASQVRTLFLYILCCLEHLKGPWVSGWSAQKLLLLWIFLEL